MATSKTLAPTNQTISIPELSDSPDMSVPADAIDKEADAINTLNSNIAKVLDSTTISGSTLAEVQTSLVTLIGGMSDLSVRQIKFTLVSSTGQIEAATYYGKVTRHNSTIAIVEIQSIAAYGDNSCIGTWRNSAWSWNRLALNEHLGNLSSLTTTAKTSAVAAINELGYTKASAAEAKRVYQSTVGFADAIGISTSTSMAAAWDEKIRDKINTFTDNQTVPFTFNNGGPYFFGILGKLNNNYYSGLLWSYHDSCQITTWQFTNLNGTYYFRPLAERMGTYPT